MKFICLGCMQEKNWDGMSKREQDAMLEECFAYDALLKAGHWVDGGEALQSAQTAKTLRWKDGKALVIDGPFAETKEQLGGFGVLEARDMDHAVELMAKHPALRHGCRFEIWPVDEEVLKRPMASEAEYRASATVAPVAHAETSKFACLGYLETKNRDAIPEAQSAQLLEECIDFDNALRKGGHWINGIALQGVRTAKTLRSAGGRVVVTDGPYAETKEHLGGLVVIGAQDMNHALELLLQHPCLRFDIAIEIRPIDEETNARWEAARDQLQNG
jgi:hypothetical protein